MDRRILLISLFILHFLPCQGRPMSKRTVSEMQLMHNLGQHKQVQERRDWLLMRVRGIHNAEGRQRRRLRPDELSGLDDLSSEDLQTALELWDQLLNSKHT